MLKLNNKPLSYDRAFTHADIQYPANWLRLSSLEERNALGITEVADAPSWDQRFYWGVDNPKDHAQLVEQWVSQVKQTAGSLLSQTDWYVIRMSDSAKPIPTSVQLERSEIRRFSDEKEAAIKATTTTAELAAYVTSSAFTLWEEIEEEEAEVAVEEPAVTLFEDLDDTLIFSGSATGAQIVTDTFSTDTLTF